VDGRAAVGVGVEVEGEETDRDVEEFARDFVAVDLCGGRGDG